MRRFAWFGVLLPLLSGCGYSTWWNPPFTTGFNPHKPAGDSENLQRVEGAKVAPPELSLEPGNIWPGPIKAEPTLQELEQSGSLTPMPEQPAPGSPLQLGTDTGGQAPSPPPQSARGSSTPPPSNQPGLAPLPRHRPTAPAVAAAPPSNGPAGRVVNTPSGTGVISGGTSGYQTMALPGGGSAIVVPNGNGTSTIIKPDGTMETIPTPK
ncbi:MAG TPA: hypothetical protein VGG99_18675 [Acetobacteraceae bacterium]|jgi:hypothetical protein